MSRNREPLRILAVHAHPDDEASKGAATMAKYLQGGDRVLVATATGGERGSVLNPKVDTPEVAENLIEIRRKELAASQAAIGFEHEWLGFTDSGMPEGELPEDCFAATELHAAAAPLVALVRRFQPHVILTYDEQGGYPHPDHIMTHRVTMEAWEKSGDASAYPEAGEPWEPLKLYYHMTFTRDRLHALNEAMVARGEEAPYAEWLARKDDNDKSARVTTRIHAADFFAVRDEALLSHATQVDPDGMWFAVPRRVQAEAWPTEDYELAHSRIATTTPESDLFTGIQ